MKIELSTSQKRQAIYVKELVKTPAWLAVKEIIRDYIYHNVGNSIPTKTLLGMKLAIREVEGIVELYEKSRN